MRHWIVGTRRPACGRLASCRWAAVQHWIVDTLVRVKQTLHEVNASVEAATSFEDQAMHDATAIVEAATGVEEQAKHDANAIVCRPTPGDA